MNNPTNALHDAARLCATFAENLRRSHGEAAREEVDWFTEREAWYREAARQLEAQRIETT